MNKIGSQNMAGRPFRCRRISTEAKVKYFKPRGIPLCELEEVVLTPDEFEALRLADFDLLYQADAAIKMKISRQTFGNIINSAHKKIADALLHGKAICINGQPEKLMFEMHECSKCGHKWEMNANSIQKCPECGNDDSISKVQSRQEFTYNPGRCRRGQGESKI